MDQPIRTYVPALRREIQVAHLVSDDPVELHAWAARLGLKRSWFQGGRLAHYDLMGSKVALAQRLGIALCDRREMLRLAKLCGERRSER